MHCTLYTYIVGAAIWEGGHVFRAHVCSTSATPHLLSPSLPVRYNNYTVYPYYTVCSCTISHCFYTLARYELFYYFLCVFSTLPALVDYPDTLQSYLRLMSTVRTVVYYVHMLCVCV